MNNQDHLPSDRVLVELPSVLDNVETPAETIDRIIDKVFAPDIAAAKRRQDQDDLYLSDSTDDREYELLDKYFFEDF